MKKALLLATLSFALVAALFTSAIPPAKAYINTYDWKGPTHYYDPYWDTYYLNAFAEGATAILTVQIYNSYFMTPLNVSAVKVFMDWNINYSSTEVSETAPFVMPYATYHWFTITFTVPAITTASNFLNHGWTIYVEEVNADGDVSSHDVWSTSSGFYVYSAAQNSAMMLYDEIQDIYDIYGWWPGFDDTAAYDLWRSGHLHYEIGLAAHENGDFATAEAQYDLAFTAYNDALASESAYDLAWQDYNDDYDKDWDAVQLQQEQAYLRQAEAEAKYYEAQANATALEAAAAMRSADAEMKQADALMFNAYGWMLFGFGFIVFGIAACIWAYKRPTHAT
ncbi:MAG: hypothetical protein WCC63_00975 [Candidatus Bathyarchaeia archaeon]